MKHRWSLFAVSLAALSVSACERPGQRLRDESDASLALAQMELATIQGKPTESYRYVNLPGMDAALASRLEIVKSVLGQQLRDPYSAQWGEAWTIDLVHVCGKVNARNAFGGYTGPKRFIAGAGQYQLEGTSDWDEEVWAKCKGDGRIIPPKAAAG